MFLRLQYKQNANGVFLSKFPPLGGHLKERNEDFLVYEMNLKGDVAGITPIKYDSQGQAFESEEVPLHFGNL